MTTQAQIEANRRNAQKSTGPVTPEGKSRAALNALKHGIRAGAFAASLDRNPLFDEDPQEFADLVQSLVDHFQPEGPHEHACVDDIAICLWRLRRVASVENGSIASAQAILLSGPGADNPRLRARNALPDLEVLDKLNRYETSIQRQLKRSFDTLAALSRERVSRGQQAAPSGPATRGADKQREIDSITHEVLGYLMADLAPGRADPEFESPLPNPHTGQAPIPVPSHGQRQSPVTLSVQSAPQSDDRGLTPTPETQPPTPVPTKQTQSSATRLHPSLSAEGPQTPATTTNDNHDAANQTQSAYPLPHPLTPYPSLPNEPISARQTLGQCPPGSPASRQPFPWKDAIQYPHLSAWDCLATEVAGQGCVTRGFNRWAKPPIRTDTVREITSACCPTRQLLV